jgi:hypothetical protein
VWDITQKPVLLIEFMMNVPYYREIYIVNDYLVVVECLQVKVYEIKISDRSFLLLFSFLINENNVLFNEPLNHSWSHYDKRCLGWHYYMIDYYLFASKEHESNSCVFHVWDIVNACKVGSFSPPIPGFVIDFHSKMGSKWLLKMDEITGHDTYFFQFDLERRLFSDNIFSVFHEAKYDVHYVIYDCCMIMFDSPRSTVCSVYDINTSKKLHERHFNDNSLHNYGIINTRVINGKFVMLCKDGFHVVDALTLITLFQFPCEDVAFIKHHLNIHGSLFLFTVNREDRVQIWDITNKLMVKKFNHFHRSHLYLNSSCTKLVCASVSSLKITSYNFL